MVGLSHAFITIRPTYLGATRALIHAPCLGAIVCGEIWNLASLYIFYNTKKQNIMQDIVSAFGDKYQTKCDDSHNVTRTKQGLVRAHLWVVCDRLRFLVYDSNPDPYDYSFYGSILICGFRLTEQTQKLQGKSIYEVTLRPFMSICNWRPRVCW